ncbi:MAG: TlpA family protein disulfide reductase [Rhodocyclaceae bacterium]|nr:MAG: TlpA family protein disulfide reductase [Rhodocyclaceae bacterium]
MKLKLFGIFALVLAISIGVWLEVSQKPMAPMVSATTLRGETLNLADLKGKVVLVNFWATSCTTCMGEMPKLVAVHQKYAAQGYETLAVAMDYDPTDYVKNYAEKNALPFKVAMDSKGDIARAFGGVRLTPTSVLIDKQGRIVQTYLGEPDFAQFQSLVESLLKKSA